MLETNQLQRLAAMANVLRPDWPTNSLYSFLAKHQAHRTYRDLAVALAYIAADQQTKTPARLNENGPWWTATRDPNTAPQPRPVTCQTCGQIHTRLEGCKEPREPASPDAASKARDLYRQMIQEDA